MATLAEIYDWFMTGKKPTQAQFWAAWGSFWNKNESIPQSAITNLSTVLNAKTENDQFNAHKVAADAHAALFDEKEDKTQKGVAGGYAPLDEFVKLAAEYLNIVDDLVTGGATALASAETVKTLKGQIDAINILLASDNVNLDNVQEIVDAIETVQTSLSTILVNDLTTGGTTKALTAEMGKSLKALIDALDIAKEATANKSQDIEADKTSTDKYGSVKAVYDWAVAKFKTWVLAINPQPGITYTFAIDDYKKHTVFTNVNPVTVTIATNAVTAIPIGTKIKYTQKGAGVVTVGGAGVTINTNVSLASVLGETRTLTKIDTDEWTLEGSIVAPVSKTSNTYFVDTVLGNNTTGVLENPAKPFATIDYVLGLSLTTNVRIVLLNVATHNLTTTIPANINVTIESNVKAILDISSNANATIMNNTVVATELTINMPLGKLYNNRSGGTGSVIASNKTVLSVILKELYWNSSTQFFNPSGNPTSIFYLNIQKIQSAVTTYAGFIQCDNGKGYIEKIAEFVCLANGCTFNTPGVLIDIALISGTGYARFGEQYSPQCYIIGDIKTTGTCVFTGYAHVTFVNSVITSANGISSGEGYPYDLVFTGSIRSVAKIASASQHQANCWIGFINFRANFGAGYLNTWRANIYFENCSITCNSYLISSAANSGGGGDFTFKNTTIEQVTPTNLINGVSGETRTIKIGGLTTNATAISNQNGTGHTVTQMTNY